VGKAGSLGSPASAEFISKTSMKNKSTLLKVSLLAGILAMGCSAQAQTVTITNPVPAMPTFSGGLQQIYDAATGATNYGLVIGGGRSTTGQRSLAFADLAYNFTPSVGLVVGYDYLWASKHLNQPSQANLVKGGVNLQANLQPLKNYGFTNFTVTPFGFALVATGSGTVSEILGTGVKTTVTTFKGFNLNVGVMYEHRTGAGFWDGNYVTAFTALSRGF
jgi:hypothetical protein